MLKGKATKYPSGKKKTATRKLSAAKLRKKAWHSFSRFIRLRDADNKGNCTCCTCLREIPWHGGECHAGHFVSSRSNSVLFDEHITHAQCSRCNLWGNGEQARYTLFMIRKYGHSPQEIEQLLNQKLHVKIYKAQDYESMEAHYNFLSTQIAQSKELSLID